MLVTFRLKDRNYLPYLLSLVHNSAEERYGVSHRLCFLEAPLHDRVAMRVATGTDLDQ